MYKNNEIMRLEEVRDLGINPIAILDVGAHTGQFYSWAKRIWPQSVVWMIEANPVHEDTLKGLTNYSNDEYLIAALGDKEREVTFYTRSDKPHTEGNSYYEENNYWDIQHLVQKSTVKLQKLDDIFTDNTTFELIKLDTQGSELDILKGGVDLCKRASGIILEVSFIEYNKGAPLSKEVLDFMKDFGFEEKMSIGEHYDPVVIDPYSSTRDETIIQRDIFFLNNKSIKLGDNGI